MKVFKSINVASQFLIVLIVFLLAVSCKTKTSQQFNFNSLSDTNYVSNSSLSNIKLDTSKIVQLKQLGIWWGFLKYHHSGISKLNINWDAALFQILHQIDKVNSEKEFNKILEDWVDNLGDVPNYTSDVEIVGSNPTYKTILSSSTFKQTLTNQLIQINKNYNYDDNKKYVSLDNPIGNPIFSNEIEYSQISYPDAGLRLLSLYRYWNMIQYYYPYRDMIKNWEEVLEKFIPIFLNAKNKNEYVIACLKLIAIIEDTHANVFGSPIIDSIKGIYICPFQTQYIGDKLVVTNYYKYDSNELNLKIGDIITEIDSKTPESFIQQYFDLISASNKRTRLKILFSASGYALRSNNRKAQITYLRNNIKYTTILKRIPIEQVSKRYDWNEAKGDIRFTSIIDSIGYIYSGNLQNNDLKILVEQFSKKKGLIIDLRCYPSVFMPFTYGNWLNCDGPFANLKKIEKYHPAQLHEGKQINQVKSEILNQKYDGKLLILVNSNTLSQGEYTTMAFSKRKNTFVIGSQTAGADGDISLITLPGGIKTLISGLRVCYPNGDETQRIGIKIDIPSEQTLAGILKGKDDQLEDAIMYLKNSKN